MNAFKKSIKNFVPISVILFFCFLLTLVFSNCSQSLSSLSETNITSQDSKTPMDNNQNNSEENNQEENNNDNNDQNQNKSVNCPSGYIPVPSNAAVGAPNDFCVMKYEAKDDGSGNAVSQANTTPWVSINQVDAWDECDSLNTEDTRTNIDNDTNNDGTYALISNPEWMTIARNVENVDTN